QPNPLFDDPPFHRRLLPLVRKDVLQLFPIQYAAEQVFGTRKFAPFQEHHRKSRLGHRIGGGAAGGSGPHHDSVKFFLSHPLRLLRSLWSSVHEILPFQRLMKLVGRRRGASAMRLMLRLRATHRGATCGRHQVSTVASPLRFFTSSIIAGTISAQSPTTPYWATLKMGAFGSLLIATMPSQFHIPTTCWTAPEIPTAMYSLGRTVWPVCPTWWSWLIHPASTTARLAPTSPPRASANSLSTLKPSGPPSPRPPATITEASSRFTRCSS